MQSPFLTPGTHFLRVYYQNQPAELITAVVGEDFVVEITGPRWLGSGVVVSNGGYIGCATITERPSVGRMAHHCFIWNPPVFEGYARYWGKQSDRLEWKPENV